LPLLPFAFSNSGPGRDIARGYCGACHSLDYLGISAHVLMPILFQFTGEILNAGEANLRVDDGDWADEFSSL
jgi:hypothetical protein